MPRAVWSFENAGISTLPAPLGYHTLDKQDRETLGYFPSAYGLYLSSNALRERMGLMWYKHKYDQPTPAVTQPASAH
jgi:uncharacterized SAM-binding protein YcdF (DUF218 family)